MAPSDQPPLDVLLEQARSASGLTRIELRDPLARHGLAALDAVAPWLQDPKLQFFAVTVIERIGSMGHKASALKALQEARAQASGDLLADVDGAISRLSGKPPPGPEPPGRPPPVGTVLIVGLRPSTHHFVADHVPGSPTPWGELFLTSCGWVFSGDWVHGHGGPASYSGQALCGHCQHAVERGR